LKTKCDNVMRDWGVGNDTNRPSAEGTRSVKREKVGVKGVRDENSEGAEKRKRLQEVRG